jgi:hypothetical protein
MLVSSLVSRADLYLVYGKIPEANRYLARASLIDPNNPDLLDTIAQANESIAVPRLEPIRDHLFRRAQSQPDNGPLWLDLAIMDTRLRHFHAATQEIDVAALTLHDPTTLNLKNVLDHHR